MSNNFGIISEECLTNRNHATVVTGGGIQELWNNIVTDLAMTAVLDGNGKTLSDGNGNIKISSGKCLLNYYPSAPDIIYLSPGVYCQYSDYA